MDHKPAFSTDMLHARYPEPKDLTGTGARWIVVGDETVAARTGAPMTVVLAEPPASFGFSVEDPLYLGHRGGIPVYSAGAAPGSQAPPGWEFFCVRDLFGRIPDEELALAALAVQLTEFDRTNRFCGRCGARTARVLTERARNCHSCGLVVYPRLSPAVIVLVARGNQVLLARSPRFPPGMFSVIAGFVEAGENLEHAIHREVREETGIQVRNIRYFGSEPWPFPHSLMIGFVADYQSGGIIIDKKEIESAFWFDREHLPRIPERMSISRALIDWWVREGEGR
ncbi:MAG TPA: NAD(+) diphosphatase [Methanoregula sp.]|nr:NAD(+) diphosphatase [Methanoregula sp.]